MNTIGIKVKFDKIKNKYVGECEALKVSADGKNEYIAFQRCRDYVVIALKSALKELEMNGTLDQQIEVIEESITDKEYVVEVDVMEEIKSYILNRFEDYKCYSNSDIEKETEYLLSDIKSEYKFTLVED